MTAQALLRRATGLSVSKAVAERAVGQRMEQTGFSDSEAYLQALTPAEMTQLIELVVVPESWLFRDPQAFYATVELVQERWARGRATRILSIPCAGGEEPYSMAMALRDGGVPKQAFSIDAYDLSPGCIERAQAGVYGRNAFRAQDVAFRDRYFTHVADDAYRIIDSLREQVTFRQGNLLQFDTATYSRHYDVIFCRNLLIYFDKPTTRAAIHNLSALLADDGMLLAGYAEVPSFCQNGFATLQFRQAFALKKGTAAPASPAQVAPLPALRTLRSVPPAPRRAAAAAPAAATAPRTRPVSVPSPAPAAQAAQADLLAEARLLADRGQLREAGEKCHAHLARVPEAAEAYFMLGIINELAGKMDLADDYWRRCIYLQPDHYEALCHLSLLAERNGNHTAAATLKARAARIYQRRQASN
ncbi:CheR family methyltransferase [Janthinobacterium lividum]|uniref:CheR family methyltransferase n=1 Tax=Janthinobacterium lividum TaxID=29581 RepID=UPI0008753BEE|nr:protein-glutamate O-methyltransferase CheR [Janthinobacterium lividum]MCC7716888.1 protein-glutamate O-methyltransferase CheR [Janthinobacterium lividum]OEZ51648.1 putative biofilm formation methyltransferase WspC [Janthinobacterium lividum]WQE30508.1 protein-glutamate O-methyltransferase CheR [Janthinobacterium lividum]STQ96003.1 Chemotaxis protein methyltransferase [Janthinobacterium lividum]